ncbi:MAG: hypothetical protein A3D65_02515 [Candidatus Lloydbacteria bacterium RIFCSPHIGHO2_02_FULL_50_13]|uniref:Uncharacterized protein n=1 Tax=Candidatus Lloydbacteria bacterium RIFCSPHIGHO2_02_FULL_50_13 TaxID=1798661 RepID=A0A1G2D5E8_9BACT|nr:MAG: hypothetical protein A3D65_02515 [Candidatus Lloydbacteria bacterium RIFCSPHIGHO2_02_FULL_50_13]
MFLSLVWWVWWCYFSICANLFREELLTAPRLIFLGEWWRGDGLARAEEGSGEESARASAFFFEKIGG